MDKAKLILLYTTIGSLILASILLLVTVCTNLSIKTLEMQAAQWKADAAKKEYELIKKQIENENLRYKVFKTLEANNEYENKGHQ